MTTLQWSCWISGDDYQLVKNETPQSKRKVKLLATCILIPVIFWIINGYLIVSHVLKGSTSEALITAAVAGSVVFLIERTIVLSTASKGVTLVRILIGICVAGIGSLGLDEVIFNNDIVMEMNRIKSERERTTITEIENQYRTDLENLQKQTAEKYKNWQIALKNARLEADGTGGSGIKGVHEIARLKLNEAGLLQNDYLRGLKELQNLRQLMVNDTKSAISNQNTSFNGSALLLRIEALFRLIKNNLSIAICFGLLTTLLVIIEFLVILVKMTQKPSNYERKMMMIEQLGEKRMNQLISLQSLMDNKGVLQNNQPHKKMLISSLQNHSIFN